MKLNDLPENLRKFYLKLLKMKVPAKLAFILLGIASTVWFLIRVIPKPSRATYPCMKAAAPIMSSFVIYLLSISGSVIAFKKFRSKLTSSKYVAAAGFLVATVITLFIAGSVYNIKSNAMVLTDKAFTPNDPVGMAQGLMPGRVVWVWDQEATDETCVNGPGDYWFDNTSGETVEEMMSDGIMAYAGEETLADSWDAIFRYFNNTHDNGDVGYTSGEKIYIKINLTTTGGSVDSNYDRWQNFDQMDATPEVVLAILKQLVDIVGVAQSDIYIGDPFRKFPNMYWDMCYPVYPSVNYCDGYGNYGRHQTVPTTEHVMKFSDGNLDWRIPQEYVDAAYLINIPCLKTHNEGGITIAAKNHQGSVLQDGASSTGQYAIDMHYPLPANSSGLGNYRHLVDYMGHEDVGGKTLLVIVDGIWGGHNWNGNVFKWQMTPFNDDYPNSLFITQDLVAIESVCFDFLLTEYEDWSSEKYPYMSGVEDYMLQAADPANWAEGITYDPEDDGTPLGSLGVYEHWNNAFQKKYSRDLATGDGIELVKVGVSDSQLDTENSGLLSNQVNKIFVDSFDVKWFATDNGISRYDDTEWDTINTDNHLLNNVVHDIAYEKTGYGDELWVATEGGLSVMSYTVDGVSSATTYHRGNSEIVSDTVTAVGVDARHNRWIGTARGLSVYKGSAWDSTFEYVTSHHDTFDFDGMLITAIESYVPDSNALVATYGAGVPRFSRTDVDGITGASALDTIWGSIQTQRINSITVRDSMQWFGTGAGIVSHYGSDVKNGWNWFNSTDGLISDTVTAVEIDDDNNIWVGTDKGLVIMQNNGPWYKYTEDEGIIDPYINDIKKDFSGNVWIATNGGVEVFAGVPGIFLRTPDISQAWGLVVDDTSSSNANISWTNGSGTGRVVFMKEGSDGVVTPVDNVTYNAHSLFGVGSELDGWYCIYKGDGNSLYVRGLSANTEYRVMVCEYVGGSGEEYYATNTIYNNPINFTTPDITISLPSLTKGNVNVYPVPFNNQLNIQVDAEHIGSMASIYDFNGRLVMSAVLDNENNTLITNELITGVYILQIKNQTESINYKIVKR
ncbi:MAG: DUF362 domain-containing protein [Bacteroidales bacterium]|nr:DUF362 domain-containing protein [Bacteroidales bacterium]